MTSLSEIMTATLKEIVGELSGLSEEKQQIAASVIHALWAQEHAGEQIHPEWEAELDLRTKQIQSGEVELLSEASMDAFIDELTTDEN